MIIGTTERHDLMGESNLTSVTSEVTTEKPVEQDQQVPQDESSFTVYSFDLMGNVISTESPYEE